MYKSLLALRNTKNLLCKKIAIGNVINDVGKYPIHMDIGQYVCILAAHVNEPLSQDPLVYELWSSGEPKQLNDEQTKSVEIAMRKEFQLIQGPPGNDSILSSQLCMRFALISTF